MVRGFTERYFLTDYSYILEKHFYFVNAPDYCFKPSLFRIFCVNSSVKVLSLQCEGPSTHIFCTSSLCTFVIYRKKERSRNQVKLSINKTKVVRQFKVCETKTLNFRKTWTWQLPIAKGYQIGLLFTLERYISGWFLYQTGVRTLSTVIRNDTIRYDSAYYPQREHFIKFPKINRGTVIKLN